MVPGNLAKQVFPDHVYVNLEEKNARDIAKSDPKAFFELYKPPVIIDEVQRVPELLSSIQILADASAEKGRFILTGLHQPKLHAGIAQSLAGRTGILKLLPLSIEELSDAGILLSRDEYIFNGFMPRLYDEKILPAMLYPSYYATYVERDVRQLINVTDQHAFETFSNCWQAVSVRLSILPLCQVMSVCHQRLSMPGFPFWKQVILFSDFRAISKISGND